MKLKALLFSALITTSFYANAEIEYYHCEKGIDLYFKFDIDAINDLSPTNSGLRVRGSLSEHALDLRYVSELKMNNEWITYRVHTNAGTVIFYINRIGKKSYTDSDFSGKDSKGVCKNYIENEDLSTFFNTKEENEALAAEKLANQPPSRNWN